jgi:hypothetical protein
LHAGRSKISSLIVVGRKLGKEVRTWLFSIAASGTVHVTNGRSAFNKERAQKTQDFPPPVFIRSRRSYGEGRASKRR